MNIAVTGINFLRQAEVAGRLKQTLPAGAVLHAQEDTRSYECDGLSAYRQLPLVVALPSNEEEVPEVLRSCHELNVPAVSRRCRHVPCHRAHSIRGIRPPVAAEITVKLLPKPESARVIRASFDDVEKAGSAVADVIAAGVVPSGLEMMDRPAARAVEEFVHAGYDLEAAALLLCEADGTPEEVEEGIAGMTGILRRAGATAIRVSSSEAERQKFWAGRKAAFPAVGRISPDYYCMDGTIPRKKLGEILKFIAAMEKKYGLRCPNVFHAGDGNLHPLILFDANDSDQLDRTERFAGEVLEKCVEVGGTITGEHGVGVEKINQMCVQFATAEIERFQGVKRAFDPEGLLNPGKNIPTLHRCAEFGRMRVRGGQLPHPELPRF